MNCTNVYLVHSGNCHYLNTNELFRKLTFFRFCGCDFREENVCSSNFCKFGVTICKSLCDSALALLMLLGYTKNGEMTLDFYGSVLSSHRFLVVISVFCCTHLSVLMHSSQCFDVLISVLWCTHLGDMAVSLPRFAVFCLVFALFLRAVFSRIANWGEAFLS